MHTNLINGIIYIRNITLISTVEALCYLRVVLYSARPWEAHLYEASTAYGDSAEAKDHTRVSEEEEEEKIWKKINKSLTILFEF